MKTNKFYFLFQFLEQHIKMNNQNLKTELTTKEKILTMASITGVGLCLSSWIGKHFISQALLTSLIILCLKSRGQEILYAFVHTFRRDML